jgi:hypothetical protein
LAGDNAVGREVLEVLSRKDVEVTGGESCWQQCDPDVTRTASTWWYTPRKNKQKLRTRHTKRRIHRRGVSVPETEGEDGETESPVQ